MFLVIPVQLDRKIDQTEPKVRIFAIQFLRLDQNRFGVLFLFQRHDKLRKASGIR